MCIYICTYVYRDAIGQRPGNGQAATERQLGGGCVAAAGGGQAAAAAAGPQPGGAPMLS